MRIKEIRSKSIVVKSGLKGIDYVVNPYIGCMHGCIFCYARFMKRFTGHKEPWGKFVDVKINAPDLIKGDSKYRNKIIFFSSTTDPYHPPERKYKLTRQCLEKLIPHQPNMEILTKSDLVLRDLDLIKQFKRIIVTLSMSTLDASMQKQVEPLANPPARRIAALKRLHEEGIRTALFISPIFPYITDWRAIINKTKKFVDEYWFENLNFYPSIRSNIYAFLKKIDPKLVDKYKEIYFTNSRYWYNEAHAIKDFCKRNKIVGKVYFHHSSKR